MRKARRRDTQLQQAANDLRIAELDVIGNDLVPRTTAEKNVQAPEEAKARVAQLGTTFELRARAEAADVRILDIQRDRADNAWKHARENADKMRITAPLDGLVVLKTIWKSGSMAEVQEGEEVRPGLPILDLVDPSATRVRVGANQADIDYLQARGEIRPVRSTIMTAPSSGVDMQILCRRCATSRTGRSARLGHRLLALLQAVFANF